MSDQPSDDHALVAAAQVDRRQFRALYERYASPMYRYILAHVREQPAAEDLTAQVFLKALENLASYRPRGSFAAWLFTIARNSIHSHFRNPRATLTLDERRAATPDAVGLLEQIEHDEQMSRLASLLERLEDGKRELLRLRYASGLTYRQIGEVVGKTEGAVKMAIHRTLDDLQEKMGGAE